MFGFIRDMFTSRQQQQPSQPLEAARREALLADVQDRYRRELMANAGKVDRERAEAIVRRMYEFAGLSVPDTFVWVEDPAQAAIAVTLIARERVYRQLSMDFDTAMRSILLGHRIRKALVSGDREPLDDQALERLSREVPSMVDASRVMREALGGRALMTFRANEGYALDTWLDAFMELEAQFEKQSPAFTKRWNEAAQSVWILNEVEHRHELERIESFGRMLVEHEVGFWNWREPDILGGSLEAAYAAIAELYQGTTGGANSPPRHAALELLREYIRHCGWCCPFDSYCIMADRPEEYFTLQDIDIEGNIEARRLMIELYGLGKYLTDKNATLLGKDEFGELYRMLQDEDEPIVVVKVINSTAEPDGTFREYFLRVPPDTRSARAGVAWSFGMRENEYKPSVET